MNKIPALKLLIPFVFGILSSNFVEINPLPKFVLLFSFLFIVVCLFILKKEKSFFVFSFILLFVLGNFALDVKQKKQHNHLLLFNDLPSAVSIEGVIKSPPDQRPNFTKYIVQVDTVWADFGPFYTTGSCIISVWDKSIQFQYGDRVLAKGRMLTPPNERNPGEFDYQKFLAAQDVFSIMNVYDARSIMLTNKGEGNWIARKVVYPVRKYIVDLVDSAMPNQQGKLLKGLLVGARGEIDYELRQAFANVGVVHVLAVSGLHVGFVLLGLMFILQLLKVPDPYKSVIILMGLYFYVHLTGFHAPVVRASVMAGFLVVGRLLKKRAQPLNSIALAGLLILILNPLELYQVGFQLSFCAVAGIILIYEKLYGLFKKYFFSWEEKGNRFQSNLLILFFVSLAAQLATLPLTVYYFGRIPILSLLANVIVVPVVGIIVGLGFITLLSSLVWFPIGIGFATANSILAKLLIISVQFGSSLPFSHVKISRPSVLLLLFYFMCLFLFVFWQHLKSRKVLIVGIILLFNVSIYTNLEAKNHLKVLFFDVGQGDSSFVTFPNGQNMLIDAGDKTDYVDYGKRVIFPYLQREGINRIDNILITHNHSDHVGGVEYLLKNINVGRVVKSVFQDSSIYSVLVDSLANKFNTKVDRLSSGDTLQIDKHVFLYVLFPSTKFFDSFNGHKNLNNTSLVVKMQYGNTSFLFTGDAEVEAESEMIGYGQLLKSYVLKVGHHGSSTSSSDIFRHLVRPEIAVVSVKKYNRFGLPSLKIMNAYKTEGANLMRTDKVGSVQLLSDGKKVEKIIG
jgi:competence protein ComEC